MNLKIYKKKEINKKVIVLGIIGIIFLLLGTFGLQYGYKISNNYKIISSIFFLLALITPGIIAIMTGEIPIIINKVWTGKMIKKDEKPEIFFAILIIYSFIIFIFGYLLVQKILNNSI